MARLPNITITGERLAQTQDPLRITLAGQNVSAETLVQRGWTLPTIKRLSAEAIARARRVSVRRHA